MTDAHPLWQEIEDAEILAAFDYDMEIGCCHVRVSNKTRPLLRRAGFPPRLKRGLYRPVPVILAPHPLEPGCMWLQLAPQLTPAH